MDISYYGDRTSFPDLVTYVCIITVSSECVFILQKLKLFTTDLLERQEYLYIFMNFMKANGAVKVLQAYLMLSK